MDEELDAIRTQLDQHESDIAWLLDKVKELIS